ncbi:unnamed protein product [Calypogeia fissa]
MYETAIDGIHYAVYNDKVVCKVPLCKNVVYKTYRTFENHVCKKHGLICSGTYLSLYALDSEEDKRQRYNARRRKQPGDIVCSNYLATRGSMRKRWSQAKARCRAKISAKYVQSFEDNRFKNPSPMTPDETLLIVLFIYVLPSLGFHAWDSLANDKDYSVLYGFLLQCHEGNYVVSWALQVLQDINENKYSHLDLVCAFELKRVATILHITFSSNDRETLLNGIPSTLTTYRQNIVDDAVAWLNKKHKAMSWESHHGWSEFESLAMNEYKSWKEYAKPHSLATTFLNLIKAYEKLKGCGPAIAEDQMRYGLTLLMKNHYVNLNNPSITFVEALANTLQDRTADPDITRELDDDEALKNDWVDLCPTPDCALESFIHKFDKQDNMVDMQAKGVALKEDDKDD